MKNTLAVLALAAALPMTAPAADFDYSYADLAYSSAKSNIYSDNFPSGHGYRLGGSFGFAGHWFVEASYQHDRFDFDSPLLVVAPGFNEYITPQKELVGGGYHFAVADGLDLLAHADYGHAKTTLDTGTGINPADVSDDGYLVGAGLRYQPTPALELDAGLDHDDLAFGDAFSCVGTFCASALIARQSGVENVLSAAARYRFGMWGVGIEYRHGSFQGWRDLLFSVRANF